jgi:hypothetical protein
MKRITSILTMCTFVIFLLAESAVAERCMALSIDCPKAASKSVVHRCDKPSMTVDPDDCSSERHYSLSVDSSSSFNIENDPCCVVSNTVQERNSFLIEHHSYTTLESRATCIDYSSTEEPRCFSHESITITCDRVHCSIPVTVLLS